MSAPEAHGAHGAPAAADTPVDVYFKVERLHADGRWKPVESFPHFTSTQAAQERLDAFARPASPWFHYRVVEVQERVALDLPPRTCPCAGCACATRDQSEAAP